MDERIYHERLKSGKTEAFFLALTSLFFLLSSGCIIASGPDALAVVFFLLFVFFLFYALNYRTLEIQLDPRALRLRFGIFTWMVPVDNIAACRLDQLPALLRLGGAGVHFMLVHDRYRASFNFLEHPRVVIGFKRKRGPVQEISFSTRRPEEVLRLLREAVSTREAA